MGGSGERHVVVAKQLGVVEYAPPAQMDGQDLFTYVVVDDSSVTDTGLVVVIVAVNDDPIARPDTARVPRAGRSRFRLLRMTRIRMATSCRSGK